MARAGRAFDGCDSAMMIHPPQNLVNHAVPRHRGSLGDPITARSAHASARHIAASRRSDGPSVNPAYQSIAQFRSTVRTPTAFHGIIQPGGRPRAHIVP